MSDGDPLVAHLKCVSKADQSTNWPQFALNPLVIKTEPCEEKAPAGSPLTQSDETKLSAEQLKKRRRNERDRKRSIAKKVCGY